MTTAPQQHSIRDFLEIVYFITAGPGLLAAAIFGLHSLKLSKQSIRVTETRARLTATADQIRYFAEVIAPRFDVFEAECDKANLNLSKKCKIEIEDDGIGVRFIEETKDLGKFASLIDVYLKAANPLNAWCAYFTHGVADEEVAYKNLFADFVHMGDLCIPWIILCEKEETSADFITLYTLWMNRLEAEALNEISGQLSEQVKDLHGRSRHVKVRKIID